VRYLFLGFKVSFTHIQPIEALKGTEKFLKVPLRGTFKNFSVPFKASIGCMWAKETLKPKKR